MASYVQPDHWPVKDPDAVLDYDIDWTTWLNGDTISASTWTVDNGSVVVDSDEHTATMTKVWLSGGTLNERCRLTNHITTAGLREDDRSVKLDVKAK